MNNKQYGITYEMFIGKPRKQDIRPYLKDKKVCFCGKSISGYNYGRTGTSIKRAEFCHTCHDSKAEEFWEYVASLKKEEV
jgi:hypothetical protein